MERIEAYYHFLFQTPTGVLCLVFGGMLIFAIIAFVAEKRTHMLFVDHPEDEDDFWDSDDETLAPSTAPTSSEIALDAVAGAGAQPAHHRLNHAKQIDDDQELYDEDEDE